MYDSKKRTTTNLYSQLFMTIAFDNHRLGLGCASAMSPLTTRGRVVKGVGHLDHVWSYNVREVVSSIPDRGNTVGWVFHPTGWLVRFSLIWTCLSFQILNWFRTLSSWGSGNYSPSAPLLYEVASTTAIPAIIIIIIKYNIAFTTTV